MYLSAWNPTTRPSMRNACHNALKSFANDNTNVPYLLNWKTSDVQEFPQDFFSLTTCLRSRDLSPTRCSRRVPHGQTLKETAWITILGYHQGRWLYVRFNASSCSFDTRRTYRVPAISSWRTCWANKKKDEVIEGLATDFHAWIPQAS
jgi:hypothetical protein